MPDAPSLADLEGLAERALAHAEGDAQVTARWERVDGEDRLSVEVTCVIDGRAAQSVARTHDEDGLRRAARAAATHARRPRARPSAGLPDPLPIRERDGFDPAALHAAVGVSITRVAIASTRGVRASEQRSRALADIDGLRAVAVGPGGLPLGALADEAATLTSHEAAVVAPTGERRVVLGPQAVAAVLDHLRPSFGVELDLGSGPLHGRFGTRIAAAAVNLAESPAHPQALPRAFDAEGVPRRPLPLIQDGILHARVHDTASAARAAQTQSTGHASRAAALAPVPEHLVLSGGGAASLHELLAPVTDGLYVPALSPAREADGDAFRHVLATGRRIVDGRLGAPLQNTPVRIEPLTLLSAVEALTASSRAVPTADGRVACVVPALRAAAGLAI